MRSRSSALLVCLVVLALLGAGCGSSKKTAITGATTTTAAATAPSTTVEPASAATSVPTTAGRATTTVSVAPASRTASTAAAGAPTTTATPASPTTTGGATQTVHATGPPNYGFTPSTFSIPAGSKVVVTNDSQAPHTWTADDGSFDSGTIAAGGSSGPVTLTKKGTFGFYCQIHGAALMHGTVTVT